MKCNDVVFCRFCGAFSGTRSRDLHKVCPKRAVSKSRQFTPRKLLQGRSLYQALADEGAQAHPRQCCWWLDPAADEVFHREPAAIRKSRREVVRLSVSQTQPSASRPLWTADARDRLTEEIELLSCRELSSRRAAAQGIVARLAIDSQGPSQLDDGEPDSENPEHFSLL